MNNILLKGMGINSQLILKLVIYVSFITGDTLLELSENGMSLGTLLEEKNLFFKQNLEADYENKFQEFKQKITKSDRIEYESLVESSKHHDLFLRLKRFILEQPKVTI